MKNNSISRVICGDSLIQKTIPTIPNNKITNKKPFIEAANCLRVSII